MSVEDLFATWSVKVNDNFSSLADPYPFQCGRKSGIPSTLGNTWPIGYYAWNTQEMISQSLHKNEVLFDRNVYPPADVKGEATEMPAAATTSISETTDMAVQAIKVDAAHYCHR